MVEVLSGKAGICDQLSLSDSLRMTGVVYSSCEEVYPRGALIVKRHKRSKEASANVDARGNLQGLA